MALKIDDRPKPGLSLETGLFVSPLWQTILNPTLHDL